MISGSGSNDLFVADGYSDDPPFEALHYDGQDWETLSLPITSTPVDIWCDGPQNSLYLATDSDGVLHYDGVSWTPLQDSKEPLVALWGYGVGEIYGVSESWSGNVEIMKCNTQECSNSNTLIPGSPSGLWGITPNEMYAVGDYGMILKTNCP